MPKKRSMDFLTAVIFVGIIITVLIFIALNNSFEYDFFGEPYPSQRFSDNGILDFSASLYNDDGIRRFITLCDYKLFGCIDSDRIIAGYGDWIFDVENKEYGYNYVENYYGGLRFTDDELDTIYKNIESRKEMYAEQGINYMLCVIPNSISVYSDKLPYFMQISFANTQMTQLEEYLLSRGCISFFDLSERMSDIKNLGQLYNNTENSINGIGAFGVYDGVMGRLLANGHKYEDRLDFSDVSCVFRQTDAKGTLTELSLAHMAKNLTVSISDEMVAGYDIYHAPAGYDITRRKSPYVSSSVLVEYTNEWDKIQLMPFFSNTFDYVIYKSGLDHQEGVISRGNPQHVIHIIREYELASLLEMNDVGGKNG